MKQFQYLLDRQRHFVVLSVSLPLARVSAKPATTGVMMPFQFGSPRWRSGYMNIRHCIPATTANVCAYERSVRVCLCVRTRALISQCGTSRASCAFAD